MIEIFKAKVYEDYIKSKESIKEEVLNGSREYIERQIRLHSNTKRDLSKMDNEKLKEFCFKCLDKYFKKRIECSLSELEEVQKSDDIRAIAVTIHYTKSYWGWNPRAYVKVYTTASHNSILDYKSSSISGCGYDKTGAAIEQVFNIIPSLKKRLYDPKYEDFRQYREYNGTRVFSNTEPRHLAELGFNVFGGYYAEEIDTTYFLINTEKNKT